VTDPSPVNSLASAKLTRSSDRLPKLSRGVHPLQDRLPGNARRCRSLTQEATFPQFAQDHAMPPIKVHGARLPQTRLPVHRARLCAWIETTGGGSVRKMLGKIRHPFTIRFWVRFGAFFGVFGGFP